MILYELVTGQMPFRALNIKEMKERIVNVDYWMPDDFSDNLKDLIQKILLGKFCYYNWILHQQHSAFVFAYLLIWIVV